MLFDGTNQSVKWDKVYVLIKYVLYDKLHRAKKWSVMKLHYFSSATYLQLIVTHTDNAEKTFNTMKIFCCLILYENANVFKF